MDSFLGEFFDLSQGINAILSYLVTFYVEKHLKKDENIKSNEKIITEQEKEAKNPNKRPRKKIMSLAKQRGEFEKPKYVYNDKNVLFPKVVGATTSFAFMNCALIMYPNYPIFGLGMLPWALVPVFFNLTELRMYDAESDKNISKEAHLTGIATGI